MSSRRGGGDETWFRLREWTKGQKEAERLAAHILDIEEYESIDPSHPLGGRDGLKDIVCRFKEKKWICAVYFPRGQKTVKEIKKKLVDDAEGIVKNGADGIAFVTNQELRLAERKELEEVVPALDLLHLERISHLLDRPVCYGIRLEFLDIEMNREEQLAFFSTVTAKINQLQDTLDQYAQILTEQDKNEPRQPVTVRPNYDDSHLHAALLGIEKKLHTCTYCGYGFVVQKDDYRLGLIGYNRPSITCPKCGNTGRTF